MSRWRLAAAAMLLSVLVACGGRPSAAGPQCREARLAAAYRDAAEGARPLVRRLYAGLRAPGLGVAVAAGGRVVWSVNCGYADLGSREPVTDHTRFRIGSVSKSLTAAALARYAEQGRLDLDAPIGRYLPGFSSRRGITPRRLAGHLAGIRHYETRDEAVNRRHFDSVLATLPLFAHDPLVADPGSRFVYSSYGYDLIGAALERVAGRGFASVMREAILEPAGMRETTLATAPAHARSTFYELENDGDVRIAPPIDLSDRLPGGGFLSTAVDLARFGSALVGGDLVSRNTLRQMFTSQRTSAGRSTGYGLGFEVRSGPLGTFAGHTGAVDGGTAVLLVHTRSRTVLALATNLGYATAEAPPPPKPGTPAPPQVLVRFIRR